MNKTKHEQTVETENRMSGGRGELPCELPCVASPAGCPPERPRAQRINP